MSGVVNILLLGVEGVGKSLFIKRLQYLAANNIEVAFDEIPSTVPTVGNDVVKVKFNRNEYQLREIGGTMAPIWKNYYSGADAVIYMIDKSNQFQTSASCIMLYTVLSHEMMKGKRVMILFNKADAVSTFSFKQLKKVFRLGELEENSGTRITILECSNVNKHGFYEIVNWMKKLS